MAYPDLGFLQLIPWFRFHLFFRVSVLQIVRLLAGELNGRGVPNPDSITFDWLVDLVKNFRE